MNAESKDENSGCSTLLSILFISAPVVVIGGSGYGLYLGTTRYLDGAPLASQTVLLPILLAVIFLGVVASFASKVRFGDDTEPPADAPWKARSIWQSDEIPETSLSAQRVITSIVWTLFTVPFAGFVLYKVVWTAPEIGWGLYAFSAFILLFPAIGVWLIWTVVKELLHDRKFGRSTLVMKSMPGRLGRDLRAHVRTPISPDQLPSDGFHIQLARFRRKVRNGRSKYVRKWQEEASVEPESASRHPDGLTVPVSFHLPSDQPPSSPKEMGPRNVWKLNVTAALSGLNYDVTFEVPVFPPDGDDASRPGDSG